MSSIHPEPLTYHVFVAPFQPSATDVRLGLTEMRVNRLHKPLIAATIAALTAGFLAARAYAAAPPRPQGWVNDYAQVLDARVRLQLNQLLIRLNEATGAEIAVLTVPSLDGRDIETYATDTYRAWGIGKKGKDNGVLILVALEEREVRIETGYGLEAILPDGKCGEIIRESMIPQFKTGDFARGLIAGSLAVARIVAEDAGTSLEQLGASAPARRSAGRRGPLGMIFPILIMIVLFPIARRNPFLFFLLLAGMSGGGRGGWNGGGFGGGGGGFGGGLSGGGGASGRW
jgi:uncharacterized protein